MNLEDHLFALEERFWTEGVGYFRRNLADSAVMVFPDPAGVLVMYKATARRPGRSEPYVARASSAYVRDGAAWKLAFHQQTPLR